MADFKRPPGEPAPATTRWGLVALVFLAGVLAAFQVGKMPGNLPALRADLGIGLVAAGWVISIFSVLAAIAGAAAGALADGAGHRRAVLFGLGATALGNFTGALADGMIPLLIARVLEGAGFIAILVGSPVLIIRVASDAGINRAIGIWSAFMPLGMTIMVALTPALSRITDWRGIWMLNAALAIAAAIALYWASRDLSERRGGLAPAMALAVNGFKAVIVSPGPLILTFVFGAYSLNFLSLHAFLPTFFIDQRGMSPTIATLLVALAIFPNAIGVMIGAGLIGRGVPRWALMIIGHAAMGLCSIGVFADGLGDVARIGLALTFSFIGGLVPVAVLRSAPVHAPAPHLIGTTNGLFNQGVGTGQLIGPPILAALVASFASWQAAALMTVSSAAAGVALALLVRRLEARRAA